MAWLYIGHLFGKLLSFAGGISTIASIILFFFGNRIFPDTIPSFFLGIMLFILTLLTCSYFVWADQANLTNKAKDELNDLKATIPVFSIGEVTVKRYTITPIIEKYKQILKGLEPKEIEEAVPVAPINDGTEVSISSKLFSPSLFSATKAIQSMMQSSLSQLKLSNMNLGFTGETSEEKYIRIQKHIIQLERYERELSITYKLDVVFSSSRAANNIEAAISTDRSSTLILDDDYARSNIPQTSEPSTGSYLPISPIYYEHDTTNFSTSYMKDGSAYSGIIKHVNADVAEELFDQSLYVVSPNGNLHISVDFISHEMIKHQTLTKIIDASNVPTVEISKD